MVSQAPRPEQAPNLRWVQGHWAGVDKLVGTPLWESDVMITSASGVHAPNMAQYAMTQILAWAHRVPRWFRFQREGRWPSRKWDTFMPDELRGRTLGILGYGSIGREVARLAKAFGMTILVTKRDAKHTEDIGYNVPGYGDPGGVLPQRIYPPEATRSMVAECDYVVVTLPLTPRTRHLFDESLLREMKPTSFLVNVGRGELINENDLVKALNKGWIAGAGLDVFETEPLPENSPLWQMEKVIMTPHISGITAHYDDRAADLFATNLRRYLAGEPLLNLVKRSEGY
jgi:phosphoglycerate dehydrogenase-like enzyme